MKRFLGVLLLSGVIGFALPQEALAKVHGIFRVVKGKVQLKSGKSGKIKRAKIGQKVFPSDTIITAKNARAKIVMIDKNVINVSPESQVTIENYEFEPGKKKKNVLLNVIYGKVRNKVNQKYDGKDSKFQVKTKSAVAGVRGTDFLVSQPPPTRGIQKPPSFTTFEGNVAVAPTGPNGRPDFSNAVNVGAGQATSVAANGAVNPPQRVSQNQLAKMDKDSNADGKASATDGSNERQPANKKDDNKKDENKKDDNSAKNKKQAGGDKAGDKKEAGDNSENQQDGKKGNKADNKKDGGGPQAGGKKGSAGGGPVAGGPDGPDDGGDGPNADDGATGPVAGNSEEGEPNGPSDEGNGPIAGNNDGSGPSGGPEDGGIGGPNEGGDRGPASVGPGPVSDGPGPDGPATGGPGVDAPAGGPGGFAGGPDGPGLDGPPLPPPPPPMPDDFGGDFAGGDFYLPPSFDDPAFVDVPVCDFCNETIEEGTARIVIQITNGANQ